MQTRYPGITKLEDGRYRVRVTQWCPKTGRKLNKKATAHTLREAKSRRDELSSAITGGTAQPKESVKLSTYANSWLAGKKGRISPSTAHLYATVLETQIKPVLGHYYIDKLDKSDIEGWLQSFDVKPVSANSYFALLRRVLNTAVRERVIPFNPAADVEKLREVRPPKARTHEEVERLLKTLEEQPFTRVWRTHVLTLADAGLRFGELAALRVDDIRGDVLRIERSAWRGRVGPTKTGNIREVPMTPRLSKALARHRRHLMERRNRWFAEGWLFPAQARQTSGSGLLRYPSQLNNPLRRASEAAGIEPHITCHQLRHTLNNRLRQTLGDYAVVQAILGHTTDAMTMHYSHISNDEKRAAVLRLVSQ